MADAVQYTVAAAVAESLRDIDAATDGYETTVGMVLEQWAATGTLYPEPGEGAIIWATRKTTFKDRAVKNTNTLSIVMQLTLWGSEDRHLRTANFIADVRKRLYSGLHAQEWLATGLRNLRVLSADEYAIELDNAPIVGAVLDVEVDFGDRVDDPYSTGSA